jgi:hypothetical protein
VGASTRILRGTALHSLGAAPSRWISSVEHDFRPAKVPVFYVAGSEDYMAFLHIDHDKRRVYLCGRRLHHGLVGLGAAAIGAVLMLHDRRDFPWRWHV